MVTPPSPPSERGANTAEPPDRCFHQTRVTAPHHQSRSRSGQRAGEEKQRWLGLRCPLQRQTCSGNGNHVPEELVERTCYLVLASRDFQRNVAVWVEMVSNSSRVRSEGRTLGKVPYDELIVGTHLNKACRPELTLSQVVIRIQNKKGHASYSHNRAGGSRREGRKVVPSNAACRSGPRQTRRRQ